MPINTKTQKQEKLLGSDIAVDTNGNFMIQYRNGYYDFATISGVANLNQALRFRLKAEAKKLKSRLGGSLPAHSTYGVGLYSMISGPQKEVILAAKAAIVSNLNQEPRIKQITSSSVAFAWDNVTRVLTITISYTLITSEISQNLIFPIFIR